VVHIIDPRTNPCILPKSLGDFTRTDDEDACMFALKALVIYAFDAGMCLYRQSVELDTVLATAMWIKALRIFALIN
jgi:hypothetical protein